MRILVIGATGFIGSVLVARLVTAGHAVIAVSRTKSHSPPFAAAPVAEVVLDVARATRLEDWEPVLAGVQAAVNCAGVLQDSPGRFAGIRKPRAIYLGPKRLRPPFRGRAG